MADIVTALIDYLGPVAGCPVVGQTPAARPSRWVLVERAGGTSTLSSDTPMVTVEVWADGKRPAQLLAEAVWNHLIRRMPPVIGGLRVVRRIPVSAPSYQPAPASGGYRYRMTVQVKHQRMPEEAP